jgi:hypothetical protein
MYSRQHARLYKTVKLHQKIFNLKTITIKHRFDWEYLTVSTKLSCCCPYCQQHVRLYKTVKLHQKIFNLKIFTIKHRFDWEYLTVGTNHSCCCSYLYSTLHNFAAPAKIFLFTVFVLFVSCGVRDKIKE